MLSCIWKILLMTILIMSGMGPLKASDLVGVSVVADKFRFQLACHESMPENKNLVSKFDDDFSFWFAQILQKNQKKLKSLNKMLVIYVKKSKGTHLFEWTVENADGNTVGGSLRSRKGLRGCVIKMFKDLFELKLDVVISDGCWVVDDGSLSKSNNAKDIRFCSGALPGSVCMDLSGDEGKGRFLNRQEFGRYIAQIKSGD